MNKYPFLERKDTMNHKGVTLIIVTSPIPSHPSTTLIDVAIESVLKMKYLQHIHNYLIYLMIL